MTLPQPTAFELAHVGCPSLLAVDDGRPLAEFVGSEHFRCMGPLFDGFLVKEAQQRGINLLCVGPGDAVWPSFHHQQASPFDQFGRTLSRRCKRNNTIVVAMDDQRGNIHAGQILPEVLMPSWNACQAGRRRRAGGDVPTGAHDLLTDALTASITPIHGTEALVGQRELRR